MSRHNEILTAEELLSKQLTPTQFVVPRHVQGGLTLLEGQPVDRKCRLLLSMAATATNRPEETGQPAELEDKT